MVTLRTTVTKWNCSTQPTKGVAARCQAEPSGEYVPKWSLGTRVGLLLLLVCLGCGGGEPRTESSGPAPKPIVERVISDDGSAGLPLPKFLSGTCRVYTSAPGWSVFIDGYPVLNPDGSILQTPCRVVARLGSHSVAVVREGNLDHSRQVRFAEDAEVVFNTANVAAGESVLLSAPYLGVKVGEPIALSPLNSAGREFDPFLSADGRGIVFAGDRSEGKGIYTATRLSPLHPFGSPELLRLTSSIDQSASPSINGEATMIVYTIPSKGRIRALTRPSPLAEYEEPRILLADADLNARFPAAQMLASGDRIYFSREVGGIPETRLTTPTPNKRQPFGNVMIVQFPGTHPRLSTDGLRQYLFDGKTLRRARRTAVNLPFAGTEKVIDLELPGYRESEGHRQFCVSDDEQWLIYSDDPVAGGDLWMVRISEGPGWGVPLSGETIEPHVIAKAEPEMKSEDEPLPTTPGPEPEEPVDPRSLPLPYAAFKSELLQVVRARKFEQAIEVIDAAQGDPDLQSVAELVEWDRQDVQQLIQFWKDVEAGLMQLKPGDRMRIGTLAVDFEKYADGVVTARARTTTVDKPIAELDAAALVSLAEPVLDEADPAAMLRPAVFLTYAGDGTSSRREKFLRAGGARGEQFRERLAAREESLARMEIAREKIAAALERIETLRERYPNTTSGRNAVNLLQGLYTRTEWRQVGRRNWETGPDGEYTAGDERVPGAILLSPRTVGDFILTMEYRTNAPTGQGGVYFTYTGQGRLDRNAHKIQLSNDAGINPDPYCTGALFGSDAPRINAAKKQGEWNTCEITVRDIRVGVKINGREVLNTPFLVEDRPREGYIALDGVVGGISYRRIILSDQSADTP